MSNYIHIKNLFKKRYDFIFFKAILYFPIKTLLILFIFCLSPIFSQETTQENSQTNSQETTPKKTRNYLTFRHVDTDKYYTGWMNPRAFISRFYANKNFDLQDALISRNPSAEQAWNFEGVHAVLEGRIATELYLLRLPYVGIGFGAALDIPLLSRSSPATLNVYGVMGQAAVFVDVFLPHQMKLRITPIFHESTHLADGYRGDKKDFGIISYEFISFELYKHYRWFTFYGGMEITYSAPSERVLRLRMQFGTDFRYPIWKEINFITGINIATLWDQHLSRHPDKEGWHPAVNFGIGFEFDRYIMAMKVSHQRGYEAATYHHMQTHLGFEFSTMF